MELYVKLLTDTAKLPTRAHRTDSGLDLYSDSEDFIIPPVSTTNETYIFDGGDFPYINIVMVDGKEVPFSDLVKIYNPELSGTLDLELSEISHITYDYDFGEDSEHYFLNSLLSAKLTTKGFEVERRETRISRAFISTGIALDLEPGYEAQIRPKSGISAKGIIAQWGTIDNDYTGDLGVILINTSNEPYMVKKGQKVAQLVIAPILLPEVVETAIVSQTDRATKGFGSTGLE